MENRRSQSSPMYKVLIAANILVFIAQNLIAGIDAHFALYPEPSIVMLRPWTLVSAMFMHGGLLHIAITMFVVFYFGRGLEKRMGSKALLSVYLASGLLGCLVVLSTTTLVGYDTPFVGASAAVLGIIGALAAMPPDAALEKMGARKVMVVVIVLETVLVFLNYPSPRISSSAAHLVGLVAGFLYGYLKSRSDSFNREDSSAWRYGEKER